MVEPRKELKYLVQNGFVEQRKQYSRHRVFFDSHKISEPSFFSFFLRPTQQSESQLKNLFFNKKMELIPLS